jgi:ABC-type sugar transport system, permease component
VKPLGVLRFLGILVLLFFVLFPFYWMVVTSLKSQAEAILFPPTLIPKEVTLEGYKLALSKLELGTSVLVTFGMIFFIVLGELITSILAAYAFSWINFKGRELLFPFY